MTNVVEILITAKDLAGPAMKQVTAQVEGTSTAMKTFHKTALVAGAGLAAIGVESIKMAAKFDSSMTLLHTQAGVAQDKMAGLKQGVLDLAGKVGQSPDSLAESLLHVESNFESMGISSSKALHLVETAAKGATVGHANLVDVTNALTAAVASGIPGVQNFDQAMGVLNATVGVGDMKMQDLANAFGSGMVATVKGYGLSIQDVGAALAVFGDNNIRGSLAGNQLRMSVQALAKPVSTAGDALTKLGLTQTTLATDMQKGGLKLALEDLVGRMHKAGISADQQGQIITEAFGRKAGAGLNILVGQMDRLESKYPALAKGAHSFGDAWKSTQETFAFQTKQLQASFDALLITVGTKLIPPVQSFVNLMLQHKTATIGATAALAGLMAATVAVSAAMKVAAAAQMLWAAGGKGLAALQGVFETVALKAMYMREAFVAAGGGVKGLSAAFASLGTGAKIAGTVAAIGTLIMALHELAGYDKAPIEIDRLTTSLGELGRTGRVTGELQANLSDLSTSIAMVSKGASDNKLATWISDFGAWTGLASGPGISRAKENVDAVDKSLANLVQNGHADTAAAAAKRLQNAWVAGGGSVARFKATMNDYEAALQGADLNQKLTADSMGLFGKQAVSTQAALDAESQAAKGLEQSIQALNAVHRGAFDAETAFYQAMADASKAVKQNGATLDLNTDAGRKNRDVLSQLAAKTEDLVSKKLKEKTSWDEVDKVYSQGRDSLIKAAEAMGDTKKQAAALADEILKAPDAMKLKVSVDKAGAQKDIEAFNAAVKKSPGSKSVTLTTLSQAAEQVLTSFGLKVKRLPNGKVTVSTQDGQALAAIANVAAALNRLDGKTATTWTYNNVKTTYSTASSVSGGGSVHDMVGATGGMFTGSGFAFRGKGYSVGGLVDGPGTETSDDVFAPWLSRNEFVVNAAQTRKHLRLLRAINEGRLQSIGLAGGGLATSEMDARNQIDSSFGISYFGRLAGYHRTPFEHELAVPTDINALVQSLNGVAGEIRAAFRGRTETHLLKELNSVGKSLINYNERLTDVNSSLDAAKTKLDGLKNSASQLSDSVKSGILSSSAITQGVSANSTVTVADLMGNLTQSRDKATAFAGALKGLKSKGLSSALIQQIGEAGVNGGGLETAGALLGASSSEISSINRLQGQITQAAGAAGATTADAVYGSAIKAQNKLVSSLERQQARLEKAMDHLAAVMQAALQRALRGKASGGIVGAAASGGLRGGLTWVGEYEPELLELPVGARVHSGPDSRRMAAAAAGGREPVVLEIRSSGSEIDELFLKVFRRIVRVRGGNVQMVLAGRPA